MPPIGAFSANRTVTSGLRSSPRRFGQCAPLPARPQAGCCRRSGRHQAARDATHVPPAAPVGTRFAPNSRIGTGLPEKRPTRNRQTTDRLSQVWLNKRGVELDLGQFAARRRSSPAVSEKARGGGCPLAVRRAHRPNQVRRPLRGASAAPTRLLSLTAFPAHEREFEQGRRGQRGDDHHQDHCREQRIADHA